MVTVVLAFFMAAIDAKVQAQAPMIVAAWIEGDVIMLSVVCDPDMTFAVQHTDAASTRPPVIVGDYVSLDRMANC